MSDDLNREQAWTQRRRDLDTDNHDLRRRLHQLTDAVTPLLDILGSPIIWRLLREDEKRWITHVKAYLEMQSTAARAAQSGWDGAP